MAALIIALVFTPILIIIRGGLIDLFWNWFIQPVFAGAPDISLVQSIGIGLVVTLLTYQLIPQKDDKDSTELIMESTIQLLIFYAIMLVTGLIVHAFAS